LDQIKDFSKDKETSKNLITNQDLFVTMMRRVWLDNSLNIACQDVFPLLKAITTDSETNQENLKKLCNEQPSYRQTLKQEWDNKELALERLADLLELARRQIRLENLIISDKDLSAPKDGQE
jgi:hypothetical protein